MLTTASQPLAPTPNPNPNASDRNGQGASDEASRVAQACKRCRMKKLKCDRVLPSCTQCNKAKSTCELELLPKRKRKSPLGAKDLRTIEDRVKRLEACLNQSGLLEGKERHILALDDTADYGLGSYTIPRSASLQDSVASPDEPVSPASTNGPSEAKRRHTDHENESSKHFFTSETQSNTIQQGRAPEVYKAPGTRHLLMPQPTDRCVSGPQSLSTTPSRHKYWPSHINSLSVHVGHLLQLTGVACFLQSGEPVLSLWSPQGIRWLSSRTSNISLQNFIKAISSSDNLIQKETTLSSLSTRSSLHALPSREDMVLYLNFYFDHFHYSSPLFHQATFMQRVETEHWDAQPQNPAWFAAFNTVLAVGAKAISMFRARPNQNPTNIDSASFWSASDPKGTTRQLFENAMAVLPDLLAQPRLLCVQALLLMAVCIQASPTSELTGTLLTVALRHLHHLGVYEDDYSRMAVHPSEQRQAKVVLWLAFVFDKDMTRRTGNPSASIDLDLEIEPPEDDSDSNDTFGVLKQITDGSFVNLFRTRTKLALIQSRVYRQLYSPWARKRTIMDLLISIKELDCQLEEWREWMPLELRPCFKLPSVVFTSSHFHFCGIQIQYYNVLAMIHQMAIFCAYNYQEQSHQDSESSLGALVQTQLNIAVSTCLKVARAAIALYQCLPFGGGNAFNWLAMSTTLTSFGAIFANIVQNPGSSEAVSDYRLMQAVLHSVSKIEKLEPDIRSIGHMHEVCKAMEEIAREALVRNDSRQFSLTSTESYFLPYGQGFSSPVWDPVQPWSSKMTDAGLFNFGCDNSGIAGQGPVSFQSVIDLPISTSVDSLESTVISTDGSSPDSSVARMTPADSFDGLFPSMKCKPMGIASPLIPFADGEFDVNLLDFDYGEFEMNMDDISRTLA